MSAGGAVLSPNFSSVTEQPSQGATRMQMSMLRSRYGWAAEHAAGKDVLEVASGAGLGLGWLAESAHRVEAGDVDEENCRTARETYRGQTNVRVRRMDALDLPCAERSFDLLLLLEALYYLADVPRFLAEAGRVLRPGGTLLIAMVNCECRGFHASPFHTKYWKAAELLESLDRAGLETRVFAGFPESEVGAGSLRNRLRNGLKTLASRCGCIPRTMRGRAVLKRIFYGRLDPIPPRLGAGASWKRMIPVEGGTDLTRYRVLYFEARSTL